MAIPQRQSALPPGGPPPYGARGGIPPIASWNVTTWLIAVNVAIFVLDAAVLKGRLTLLGHFSIYFAIQRFQVWRFITFQFLHFDIGHLFFNMLALYSFGKFVEAFLGGKRFLAFYLICGVAGAGAFLLLSAVHLLVYSPFSSLVGASAGVFGVLIAAARVAPNLRAQLIFPPIELKLRTLAWVFIGIAVATIVWQWNNAGGEAAHLGGAVAGALLIQFPQVLAVFAPRPRKQSKFWKPGDPSSKFFRDE